MLAKLNDDPVKGARCISCQQEQQILKLDHPGDISTSEHLSGFIAYVCQNENCRLFGALTRTFRPPIEVPVPVETKPAEKR